MNHIQNGSMEGWKRWTHRPWCVTILYSLVHTFFFFFSEIETLAFFSSKTRFKNLFQNLLESMKNHTFCIAFQFFLLSLHLKYEISYPNGYRKSHKRAKGFVGNFSARPLGLFWSGHLHSEGFGARGRQSIHRDTKENSWCGRSGNGSSSETDGEMI